LVSIYRADETPYRSESLRAEFGDGQYVDSKHAGANLAAGRRKEIIKLKPT
jgi:hypothetical protein